MTTSRLLSALAVVGLAVVLVGCDNDIRIRGTQFVPEADGRFIYISFADELEYPVNDPDAEATRMRWLNQYIEEEHICPTGQYEVTERTVSVVGSGWIQENYQVVYRGQCLD